MENNHLTYFKVENFKKFKSLEVSDIGQFNLIVGDNNVGKTCLLEALLFDEDAGHLLDNFYIALTKRGLKFQIEKITSEVKGVSTSKTIYPEENYFKKYIFKECNSFEDKLSIQYKNKKEESLEIVLRVPKIDSEWIQEESDLAKQFKKDGIRIEDFEKEYFQMYLNGKPTRQLSIYSYNEKISNSPLVCFKDSSSDKVTIDLYNNLDIEGEEFLLNTLKIINPELFKIGFKNEFEDLKDVFVLSFNGEKKQIPINFLGDGFKRIFFIILKTISLKGKRIMIDEFEIGIHHSKLKDFWVNIFKVCKELDVQLFATTHSDECIEDYVEAAKEVNEQNIRLIRLQENKDKSIKAICYPFNEFEDIAESKTENR